MHPDWLVPKWPAMAQVQAVCTTRAGGRSVGLYESMNLGDHVGDNAFAVGTNRALLQKAINAHPVFLSQQHGIGVIELQRNTRQASQADASFTREAGVACTVLVADCLPVLFTDLQGSFVAAAHAGWRGLAGQAGIGVLESVSQHFLPSSPKDRARLASRVLAWLGPCIGPDAFEVGSDVKGAFEIQNPMSVVHFRAKGPGKWLANLPALARQRLAAMGLQRIYGNDGSPVWCTVRNPARYFSHRRDGESGRMAACIWKT
jgi:YfiH family protein